MIKVYQWLKLFKKFENLKMKKNKDIIEVFNFLNKNWYLNKNTKIPPNCEAKLQYIMRMNWFYLETF